MRDIDYKLYIEALIMRYSKFSKLINMIFLNKGVIWIYYLKVKLIALHLI